MNVFWHARLNVECPRNQNRVRGFAHTLILHVKRQSTTQKRHDATDSGIKQCTVSTQALFKWASKGKR